MSSSHHDFIGIATSTPSSVAMKPRTEKMAKPAVKEVMQLPMQTIIVSRRILLWNLMVTMIMTMMMVMTMTIMLTMTMTMMMTMMVTMMMTMMQTCCRMRG